MSTSFEYEPIWSESKQQLAVDFVKKICAAKLAADKNYEELANKINSQHQGLFPFLIFSPYQYMC